MKHTENELKLLKTQHIEMWNLVQSQVVKAFKALQTHNTELAREIVARERVVNAQELVVDHHCENFIALFAPVAIDLRFVLSLLKINNNLERIGDFAEGIALFVLYQQKKPISADLFADLHLGDMIENAQEMFDMVRTALVEENSSVCGKVLGMDEVLDTINANAVPVLATYIASNPQEGLEALHLHSVIRRIERMGDRISNIAEDIVFFVDARELRHSKK